MKKKLFINPQNLTFALAFSLGLGMFKISSVLLVIVMASIRGNYRRLFSRIEIGGWILLVLSILFLVSYWFSYKPYKPELFSIEDNYFVMIFVLSFCALMMPFAILDKKSSIYLIGYLCAGAFTWAAVTVMTTQFFSDPPYYGRIIDLRALARGTIKHGNTPGIASLLIFWPILFFANLIHTDLKRSHWALGASIAICFLAILDAILIQQRSFFIIAFLFQPLMVGCFAFLLGMRKTAYCLIFLLIIYPLLLVINFYVDFLGRKIDAGLLFDARIQMFKFWFNQFMENPFEMPIVGPKPWDIFQHFHNFFADLHRVSGFWALIFAIVLLAYIFFRLIYLIRIDGQAGAYLLSVALPMMLIMLSSVVPEGEKQPFLAILMIGAISEVWITAVTEKSGSSISDDFSVGKSL